uniref:Uncharacterized protein n=1 Tax=Anguilla anguilla TaxID=7936 RepID=A0A0E9T897_ANGAN
MIHRKTVGGWRLWSKPIDVPRRCM